MATTLIRRVLYLLALLLVISGVIIGWGNSMYHARYEQAKKNISSMRLEQLGLIGSNAPAETHEKTKEQLSVKDESLSVKEGSLSVKEGSLAVKDGSLSVKDGSLAVKDESLAVKDGSLSKDVLSNNYQIEEKEQAKTKEQLSVTNDSWKDVSLSKDDAASNDVLKSNYKIEQEQAQGIGQINQLSGRTQFHPSSNSHFAATNSTSSSSSSSSLINVIDLHRNSSDRSQCVKSASKYAFFICIHPTKKDVWVSQTIKQGYMWEKKASTTYQALLQSDPTLGVIDIGANIGQYTLLAAAMHRSVVAVEARSLHVEMIHHAIQLNKFQDRQIFLLHNAMSDKREMLSLILTDKKNQGMTKVGERGKSFGIPADETTDVQAILLDDLLDIISFRRAVMKIDIEGAEEKALRHVDKLLSTIYIPYIFMEWQLTSWKTEAQQFVRSVMDKHRYMACSIPGRLLRQPPGSWPVDVVWTHADAMVNATHCYDIGRRV